MTCYSGQRTSLATCHINNKILNCETSLNVTFNDLVFLKTEKSEDSSVTWKNVTAKSIPMILVTNATLSSIDKLYYYNNKYNFYLKLVNKLPKNADVIIDIIVNNTYSNMKCTMNDNNNLLCLVDKYDNNTLIYLSKIKTEKSSLTWLNLEKNQIVTPVNLGFLGAYDKGYTEDDYTFKILTYNNYLLNDIEIPVSTRYPNRYSTVTTYYIYNCLNNDDILYCKINSGEYIELMLFTNREDIKWINGDNSGIKIGSSVRLAFIQINSFLYNNEEKFYEFEIKIDENGIKNEFEVIDICIGENNTYAYCQVKDMLLKCKTKTLEYSDKDIYLLVNKNFGSVEWKNLEKNIKINNLISVDFLQAYNLNFNNGKWKFLIKYNNIVNFEEKNY